MNAKLIDGRSLAASLRSQLKEKIHAFSPAPCLAFILVGDNPASQIYVKNKIKACEEIGIKTKPILFDHLNEEQLIGEIKKLNEDNSVHGILVQLPLPDDIDVQAILCAVDPMKDVDGFHPVNAGKLAMGLEGGLVSCTPKGILKLLHHTLGKDLSGKNAVVIGRSNIVGRPVAELLLHQDCTVTVCHHLTRDITRHTKQADILVVAAGSPKLVQADWVKPGAVVIDVGINRKDDGHIIGDVDFETVQDVAGFITPVPGGVGPMTIACLLENVIEAYKGLK